jgi:ribosomal protein S6--L-glutamate ligase
MSPLIGFLLGVRPGPHSVLPKVVSSLRDRGAHVSLALYRQPDGLPTSLFAADVVVLRGLAAAGIRAALAFEEQGIRCCNSVVSTARARDKPDAFAALLDAGVPVPRTEVTTDWVDVCRRAVRRNGVVVKSANGSRGAGVLVAAADPLPARPPFAGPYLLQDFVPHSAPDRKVYVIGDRIAGVMRPWPPAGIADKIGCPFTPDPEERAVALAAGGALRLEIYGVDLIASKDGPVVVDVNAFPGFKGVPEAERDLANYLLTAARERQEVSACAQ